MVVFPPLTFISLILLLSVNSGPFPPRNGADTVPVVQAQPSIRMVPNPVKNRCELQVHHFNNGEAMVTIINAAGGAVYREKRLLVTAADRVVLFLRLPPGVYTCFVLQGQKKARMAFVVSD